jgi:ABC-type multidrug transport system ATPase subunit
VSAPIIEVHNLTKSYGDVKALRGVSFSVEEGEVFGLLGPNGAGKTTTLRMLLGLVRPTTGTIRVLGLPPGEPSGLRRVGAVGETAFYPFLSGRDNLRAAARRCKVKDARVDAVLEVAGLTVRAGDRVSAYSLGMRQRLAVAAAILKDPELLILDEPSNGLDPIGQLEMRRLIRELADGGRTILLSSHDMREVEELCGRVAVIGGGRMLSEGTPDQLRGQARLWVRAKPARQAAALVAELASRDGANLQRAEQAGELLNVVMRETGPSQAAAVNRELVEAGLEVSEIRTERRPLRDVFLELTGGRSGGADSLRQPAGRRRRRAGRAPDEVH